MARRRGPSGICTGGVWTHRRYHTGHPAIVYDLAVIGLGAMGSATAAHAARRGMRVIGFEQYSPAHNLGASHGRTRLIRMAYFEGDQYVPLLQRAYALWDELEVQTSTTLRSRTGAIFVGLPDTKLIAGSIASAKAYNLDIEHLEHADLKKRYPMMRPHAGEVGVFEPMGGVVFPESAVSAQLHLAQRSGAILRFNTTVVRWTPEQDGTIEVHTQAGEPIRARSLALCLGPWFEEHSADLRIERNVQAWFEPLEPELFSPSAFPAFALERGTEFFYGFPDYGDGVKCAFHHTGDFTHVRELDRTIHEDEIERARAMLAEFVPQAAGTNRFAAACMYALSPDQHFIIGPHPQTPNVYVAGGFSGHGFKFAPVIGEIMANYAQSAEPGYAIEMFSPTRF